ncbi:60S ribosomal L18a-like protein [Thalictrum thalictroides]|uniref:60S ribosomal L18a-like protein n=1 Tax=Thalictrum thalictroides TaxID=46969 RepID=A0A7J6UUD5_THATH|nr:60S ribosomal L18a-like protein [Thalictrum thalictroides]
MIPFDGQFYNHIANNLVRGNKAFVRVGEDQHHKISVLQHHPDERNSTLLTLSSGGDHNNVLYKPLPCFGFGIGWFCFILGFLLPLLWYYATFFYFRNHYLKDPRERPGLAASAIAALIFSVTLFITLLAVFC